MRAGQPGQLQSSAMPPHVGAPGRSNQYPPPPNAITHNNNSRPPSRPDSEQRVSPVPPAPAGQAQNLSRTSNGMAGAAVGTQPNHGLRSSTSINPALENVFRPLMELIQVQSKKMYGASPPEVEMIFARTPQGGQPKQGTPGSPNNDWDLTWMQLSGTSLSVWSMKETQEATKRGERVPPTYYNATGKFLAYRHGSFGCTS